MSEFTFTAQTKGRNQQSQLAQAVVGSPYTWSCVYHTFLLCGVFLNKYSSLVEQGGWRETLNISGDSFKVICLCLEHKDSRERDCLILGHPGRVTAASCCSQVSHSSGLLLCWLLGFVFYFLGWSCSAETAVFIYLFSVLQSLNLINPKWSPPDLVLSAA